MSGNPSFVVDGSVTEVSDPAVRPLRVALLGFGTVGASVARILVERPELGARLQLTHVFNRTVERKRVDWVPQSVEWTEDFDDVLAASPDVVVEVVGGVRPAGEWVGRALARGISVVTANKMLLAAEAPVLLHLAASSGAELRFEAAVGGGIPVIRGIREGLAGDRLTSVTGILNGTSNFILSRMAAAGESMNAALEVARQRGYAEADPGADLDGHDAAAKLVVLTGIAFGHHLDVAAVPRRSITPVSSADFRYAQRLGCTIRQIAAVEGASERAHGFHAFVGPALVPVASTFGRNEGAENLITLRGEYAGSTSFSGAGAGGPATAVAVVSDLLTIASHSIAESRRPESEWLPGIVVAAPPRPWYLRFVVKDRPGILASIAATLAAEGINIDAVLQEPGYSKEALTFVVTVESCDESALHAAVRAVASEEYHAQPPLALPMLLGV